MPVDSRSDVDRRRFTWRTVIYGFVRSRRHNARRASDLEPVFIDWHHPWLFFLATGIMLMNAVDAFFTIELVERGAYEANPLMAVMMDAGTATFAATKMLLTGSGILALVFLARSRFLNRIRTGIFLTALFSFYAVLICYEFVKYIGHL